MQLLTNNVILLHIKRNNIARIVQVTCAIVAKLHQI